MPAHLCRMGRITAMGRLGAFPSALKYSERPAAFGSTPVIQLR